jgi:hypothetical protein
MQDMPARDAAAASEPDQPIHTGALIELRSGTPTGWAGSSYGAQSRTTWSYITAVACISAGIRTTSWL